MTLFADDSTTIVTKVQEIGIARECMYNYEKSTAAELHEGKTKVMKIGRAKNMRLSATNMGANLSIVEGTACEKYLGDIISENGTLDETIKLRKLRRYSYISEIRA